MSKPIDHEKLNEFFGVAADFADLVGQYNDKKAELSAVEDAKEKARIQKDLEKKREEVRTILKFVGKEAEQVSHMKTVDGGIIKETLETVEAMKEELRQAA